jgi:hypothetical protein
MKSKGILKKIIEPMLLQGNLNKKNYFEGWYFKLTSEDKKNAISFIPGISLFRGDEHCFVQYILKSRDLNNKESIITGYLRFPIDYFYYKEEVYSLEVGKNTFGKSGISISISADDAGNDNKISIDGKIQFGTFSPINRSALMPNIMGLFAYIPKMECYHGIVSMNHTLSGKININGTEIDFNNGKGYIEKDWGTSFPKKYIWMQCNNFTNYKTSLFASVAVIPFLGMSFLGYICNLSINDKEYRFATYNFSKLIVESASGESIILIFENKKAKLRIEASISDSANLIAPKMGKMEKIIKEEISGETRICLIDKVSGETFEDMGYLAGIENVGY